jgi:hypothetical protein
MNFGQKKEHVRKILRSAVDGIKLSKEDANAIEEFCQQHHTTQFDIDIAHVWTETTSQTDFGPQKNFYFKGLREGKPVIREMLSVNNTYSNPEPKRDPDKLYHRRLNVAMRVAVDRDSIRPQRPKLLEHNKACQICGTDLTVISPKDIHIDHCGEYEYRHIKDLFLQQYKESIPITQLTHGYEIGDPVVSEAWTMFHNAYAQYQVVCQQCNLKKAKK